MVEIAHVIAQVLMHKIAHVIAQYGRVWVKE